VSGREWLVALGVPAGAYFMGVGLTMDEAHLFIGLGVMLLAAAFLTIDWLYINRHERPFRKLVSIPILAVGLAYPAWIWVITHP
jgi:hypothetical protein